MSEGVLVGKRKEIEEAQNCPLNQANGGGKSDLAWLWTSRDFESSKEKAVEGMCSGMEWRGKQQPFDGDEERSDERLKLFRNDMVFWAVR